MRVLVTGGLGYVGHALVTALTREGHAVAALTTRRNARSQVPDVRTVRCDIRDTAALSSLLVSWKPEGIYHLAARTTVRESFEDPVGCYDVNVGGTTSLLEAIDRSGVGPARIVHLSTGAVYRAAEGRLTEDSPLQPSSPYGASKLAAEQLLAYYAGTGRAGVVNLRCFNITGAVGGIGDPDTSRIVPKALSVALGTSPVLTVNGDGAAVREYTGVADVAAAAVAAMSAAAVGSSATFNVGSGIEASVSDVISAVEEVGGHRLDVEHLPPKPEPMVMTSDSTALREALGWRPKQTDLKDLIKQAWEAARLSPPPDR